MSILLSIKKEFDYRHDFKDEDIDYLLGRFPDISFHRIPLAWVAIIDDMLSNMEESYVKEVRQEFGQLIVLFNKQSKEEYAINKAIVDEYDDQIKMIDQDLHALF